MLQLVWTGLSNCDNVLGIIPVAHWFQRDVNLALEYMWDISKIFGIFRGYLIKYSMPNILGIWSFNFKLMEGIFGISDYYFLLTFNIFWLEYSKYSCNIQGSLFQVYLLTSPNILLTIPHTPWTHCWLPQSARRAHKPFRIQKQRLEHLHSVGICELSSASFVYVISLHVCLVLCQYNRQPWILIKLSI